MNKNGRLEFTWMTKISLKSVKMLLALKYHIGKSLPPKLIIKCGWSRRANQNSVQLPLWWTNKLPKPLVVDYIPFTLKKLYLFLTIEGFGNTKFNLDYLYVVCVRNLIRIQFKQVKIPVSLSSCLNLPKSGPALIRKLPNSDPVP